MELPDKVALITGSSRGIGRALAFALAKSGCQLLLTAVEEDELVTLAKELANKHGTVVAFIVADLVDATGRQIFLNWLCRQEQKPDILINNAGAGYFGRFSTSRWPDIEETLILNTVVPVWLLHEGMPELRKRPQAKIVMISSGIARLPYPGLAVYGAAKGFLSSLSESLMCEHAGSDISILCVHPGFTDTQFMSSAGMDMRRIPRFFINPPERLAIRIVRAIEKDQTWVYGDILTHIGVACATLLPHRIRAKLFRNLYWELPNEA